MGVSSDGILAYGYDLGGEDAGWKITQAGEWGEWTPHWPNSDPHADPHADPDEADRDLAEDVRWVLLAAAGFTETAPDAPGYDTRLQQAEQRVGVELISYTAPSYPQYLLCTHEITVHRGDVETVDFPALEARRVAEGWDTQLADALDALGIRPHQPSPGWLLVSFNDGYP